MAIIKQMPELLANQIAAGEVVERPASVVKELVENAIDAKSSEIIIELVEAGIQKIKVTDNGLGMDEEDIELAFLPHATSKIYSSQDLFQIMSLGFRGEALASIASISKVRLESKQPHASQGHFIEIEGSNFIDRGVSPGRDGTSITVSSIFYNTPARLKHLRSLQTELAHSLHFVQNIALAYPDIRFQLIHNQQEIFSTHGKGDLRQAIASVYQPSLARKLVPIKAKNHEFDIEGYLSDPTLTRTSKRYIHWIINGRPVKSYLLDRVLIESYGKQLMIGRYPVAVIHLNLDPRLIDVNIHPTKQTVRLSKEDEVSDILRQGVIESLNRVNPIPQVDEYPSPSNRRHNASIEAIPLDMTATAAPEKSSFHVEELKHNFSSREDGTSFPEQSKSQFIIEGQSKNTKDLNSARDYQVHFHQLRYVGQIHGTYLVAESPDSFYLIDQHAAQERIRYEQFMEESIDIQQQHLLMPLLIQVNPEKKIQIMELIGRFEELGLYLEDFGPQTFKLESYPNWIDVDEVEVFVYDLLEILIEKPNLSIQEIKEDSIIMRSCRGAIKANHYLDDKQATALIQQLDGLDDPYHCPHGRPIFIEFTSKNLEKLFKRIQDSHERGYERE